MIGFAELPAFQGTSGAYGIDTVWMPMEASLLPGGGSPNAAIPTAWINPGMKSRGIAGMAGTVPGRLGGLGYLGEGSNSNSNAATASASNVSSQTSTQSQSFTPTITMTVPGGGGGALSTDNMPVVMGLGGLALFGGLLYLASKKVA